MNQRRKFIKTSLLLAPVIIFPKLSLGNQDPNKPNVLIIGDSISIGYTPFVKDLLSYRANIFRPLKEDGTPENCQGTTNGVKNIKRWLGDTKWEVIHFNFGLHDIKHIDPVSGKNSNNSKDPQQADLKQYKTNLKAIVEVLKTTGAKLIFATTTPYPDNVGGPLRKPGMPAKYNKAAIKIMNSNGIAINHLYVFMKPRMNELQRPNNVHFTPQGSKALAEKVAERITEALLEN
jgi:hypothetical protein